MLTDAQVADYRRDGYLVVEGAVPAERLAALAEVTEGFVRRARGAAGPDDVFDLEPPDGDGHRRLSRIKTPHLQHELYRETLRDPALTGLVTPLLGPDVRLHNSKLNVKAAGGGAAVEWHQDWAFYPHTNDDLLAVGIMLEEVTEENGPLLVVPGSHTGPVLSHLADGVFCGAVDPDDPAVDLSGAVALTGPAGSVSLHHVRLLHGSSPNRSSRSRRVLFYELGAADAWPIAGGSGHLAGLDPAALWAELAARTVCGVQGPVARLAEVPVVLPLPAAPDASSIFAIQRSGGARTAFG